jgi:NitT/TauT family transport system substrate-binding protein
MQTRNQSPFAYWAVTALVALASVAASGASIAQDTVRIAVGVDPVFTPWWIAQEKGYYAKYGLKAEITQTSGGPVLADATMSGETDIGSSGTATWMPRIIRGSMVILGTMATSPDCFKMAALTSIKSLDDLKGKKVGTVGGSVSDYLWYLTARKLNVAESAFTLVPMTPPELVPSLDRKDIDAYFVWEPWPARALEVSGKDKVHMLANSGDLGYMLYFIVVANRQFVESKPEVAIKTLAALRDAIAYQNAHKAEAIKVAAASNKMKPDLSSYVLGLYSYALNPAEEIKKPAALEEAWMRTKERVKGPQVDWNKTVDDSYLKKAMALK